MRFHFKIWLLILIISFFYSNNTSFVLANEILIYESILIEPHGHVIFNFTISEETDVYFEQKVNSSVYPAFLNETSYASFLNNEIYYDISGFGNFSIYSRLFIFGKIILVIINTENSTVSGSIFVEKIIHLIPTTNEDNSISQNSHTNETTNFFFFLPFVALSILISIKKK